MTVKRDGFVRFAERVSGDTLVVGVVVRLQVPDVEPECHSSIQLVVLVGDVLAGQAAAGGADGQIIAGPVVCRCRHGRYHTLQYHLSAQPLTNAPVWNPDLRSIWTTNSSVN